MPTILPEDLASEWPGLSEQRIKEIASFQIPSREMNAHTIRKVFQNALDPIEAFEYEGLQAIKEFAENDSPGVHTKLQLPSPFFLLNHCLMRGEGYPPGWLWCQKQKPTKLKEAGTCVRPSYLPSRPYQNWRTTPLL
jgi:hypothetical protein